MRGGVYIETLLNKARVDETGVTLTDLFAEDLDEPLGSSLPSTLAFDYDADLEPQLFASPPSSPGLPAALLPSPAAAAPSAHDVPDPSAPFINPRGDLDGGVMVHAPAPAPAALEDDEKAPPAAPPAAPPLAAPPLAAAPARPVPQRDVGAHPIAFRQTRLGPAPHNLIDQREADAWDSWRKRTHGKSVREIIRQTKEHHYFSYNDHKQQIIPRFHHDYVYYPLKQRRRTRNRTRDRHQELALMQNHPYITQAREQKASFLTADEFSRTHPTAEQARIGEYCKVDIAPRQLYIKLFKGIQTDAIRILARRLHAHVQTGVTRFLLKHKPRRGTFSYAVWLPSTTLKGITEDELYTRLLNITNSGKKNVNILVRQNIVQGYIQDLWATTHSLL
jgi:hypothetical protein